jgi:hypothetical protein
MERKMAKAKKHDPEEKGPMLNERFVGIYSVVLLALETIQESMRQMRREAPQESLMMMAFSTTSDHPRMLEKQLEVMEMDLERVRMLTELIPQNQQNSVEMIMMLAEKHGESKRLKQNIRRINSLLTPLVDTPLWTSAERISNITSISPLSRNVLVTALETLSHQSMVTNQK